MQTIFLKALKKSLPNHISANRWLAELLGIDETTASRKYSGAVNLSVDELGLILKEKPVLAATLVPDKIPTDILVGEFVQFTNLSEVGLYLEKVKATFTKAVENKLCLKYFGRDLPIFHFFSAPDLFKFKVAMWCNEVSMKYLSKIDNDLYQLAAEIYELYLELESWEIWYRNVLKNQIFQLNYHFEIGKIDNTTKEVISKGYQQMISRVEDWCLHGRKGSGAFQLSISDYATLNNGGMLVKDDQALTLMTALSSVYFVSTTNRKAIENFSRDYDFHKKQAIPIAGTNERSRNKFISQLNKTLKKTQ